MIYNSFKNCVFEKKRLGPKNGYPSTWGLRIKTDLCALSMPPCPPPAIVVSRPPRGPALIELPPCPKPLPYLVVPPCPKPCPARLQHQSDSESLLRPFRALPHPSSAPALPSLSQVPVVDRAVLIWSKDPTAEMGQAQPHSQGSVVTRVVARPGPWPAWAFHHRLFFSILHSCR